MTKLITGSLSRIVPAHIETVRFLWIQPEFMRWQTFKESRIRAKMPLEPWHRCNWCERIFFDGDVLALAGPIRARNVVLCQECAAAAQKDDPPPALVIDAEQWKRDPRTARMFELLLECRDALPALTIAQTRIHRISLSLADRIEAAIAPWAVPPETPGAR